MIIRRLNLNVIAMMRRCFPFKDIGDDDVEYLVKGESLVIRQALNMMIWSNKKRIFFILDVTSVMRYVV
jgi:hypothetical protein